MTQQLFIPKTLKIGLDSRTDTYSGLLGFITYIQEDGTNKHKKSWENWRDKKLGILELDNSPIEGFVINKREGGGGRWSYNEREAKIRVWDPRGFEIEITIENMLDLLAECGSFPGKGLEGEFVYGWDQLRLSLISIKSELYKKSLIFSNVNVKSITENDLIIGGVYLSKKVDSLIYMGKVTWTDLYSYSKTCNIDSKYIFYKNSYFVSYKLEEIATCVSSNPVENIAELIGKMESSENYVTPSKIEIINTIPIFQDFEKRLYESEKIYISGNFYSRDIFWLKKDEITYEGVIMYYVFPETDNRYAYPNGIKLSYNKKIVIVDGSVKITKSSKKDNKIYQPDDLKLKEFFKITYLNKEIE